MPQRAAPFFFFKKIETAGDSTDNTPATSRQASPAINVARREYSVAVQSNSYNEIWSAISNHHVNHHHHQDEEMEAEDRGVLLLERVVQPNRECVEEALRAGKPNALTRLVSAYFDHSKNTTHLCLLLHRCLVRACALYAPLHDLLHLLPSDDSSTLSQSLCDRAFDIFINFDAFDNPFPSPDSHNFDHLRGCFSNLRRQLDRRLPKSRSTLRLFCSSSLVSSTGSHACSIATTAITGSVHALAGLVAGPSCTALPRPPPSRSVHSEAAQMAQLDAAAKAFYVLVEDCAPLTASFSRLHSTVEGDKLFIRLVLDSGREAFHPGGAQTAAQEPKEFPPPTQGP